MLLTISKFSGVMPIILDPSFLPDGKSQAAINCRFDQHGLTPYLGDSKDSTPTLTGIKETIFRYYNTATGNQVFFVWPTDVDAVNAPLPNDDYVRVFYTEQGVLKVTDKNLYSFGGTNYPMAYKLPSPPPPGAPIVATPTVVAGSPPTDIETKAYVYTYVNSYGSEGPPSDPSNFVDIYDGNSVALSGMDTGPTEPLYDIIYKRIYRLNQASDGTSNYQFVAEIAVATTTYADAMLDAELGELMASLEWDGAPLGIKGLIALPNGMLAGFFDNILCLSVPYYPHAWPVSYQKAVDRDIVAIGAYGTTIVVVTKGQPYLSVGNDPANMVLEKMDIGFSCMSKRGLIQMGDIIAYPSPEGLVVIGPQVHEVVTAKLLTMDQWINTYNPSTISAYYWQGKYIGFYTSFGYQGGFMMDLKTGDFLDLAFYATAGYHDKTNGVLFLQIDNDIMAFGQATGSYRDYSFLTKRYKYRKNAFTCVKILAATYPVNIDIIYPEIPYTIPVVVEGSEPFRIPTILSEAMEVRITGAAKVYTIFLAGAIEELLA